MSKKTAFVTGSTGFLGITLSQELVRDGWQVIAFHRVSSDLKELKKLNSVQFAVGDITDSDSVLAGLPEHVDAVFHAAGSVGFFDASQDEMQYKINTLGTQNVIEAALKKKTRRFIHTSTILTYDYRGRKRVDERTPPNDHSKYSYINSKYLGDLAVEKARERGLDAVVLHPTVIFGAYDRTGWSQMFTEISRGPRVPLAPPGGANVCHMREVARAHVSAFYKGRTGEHYMLGGPDKTFREMIDAVAAVLEKPGPRFTAPAGLFRFLCAADRFMAPLLGRKPMVTRAEGEILCETCLCSSDKAMKELGYQPAELQTMLEDCHSWMKSEGLL